MLCNYNLVLKFSVILWACNCNQFTYVLPVYSQPILQLVIPDTYI